MSDAITHSGRGRPTCHFIALLVAMLMAFGVAGGAFAHADGSLPVGDQGYAASFDDHHDDGASGTGHCHASASCAFIALGVETSAFDWRASSAGLRFAVLRASGLSVSPENPPPIRR